MRIARVALCSALVALAALQGCSGMEIKGPDEFGYQRRFNPPA